MKIDDTDLSPVLKKALDDLESLELEFTVEEPEARAKKIEGKLLLRLRGEGTTEH